MDNYDKYLQDLGNDALALKLKSFTGQELDALQAKARAQGVDFNQYLRMNSGNSPVVIDRSGDRINVSGPAVATFEISIVRALVAGSAFTAPLPAPIGFPYSYQMNYQDLLFGMVNTTLGITSITSVLSGSALVITFSDGTNSESLTITCADVAYPYWLNSLVSNYMVSSAYRMSVDPAETDQFKQGIRFYGKTNFGKVYVDQSITPNRFLNPNQNQNNVVDVDLKVKFSDTSGIIQNIGPGIDGAVNLNFFVSEYSRPTV